MLDQGSRFVSDLRKVAAQMAAGRTNRFTIGSPGSEEALLAGCLCPQIDNHHGAGTGPHGDEFWVEAHCPVHGGLFK